MNMKRGLIFLAIMFLVFCFIGCSRGSNTTHKNYTEGKGDNTKGTTVGVTTLIPFIISNNDTLFSDNFDSYVSGTFPSSGGWQLLYNGEGTGSQYVDNTYSVSSPNSLHLVGSSCWSANAYYPVTIPSTVTLEANVLVDHIASGGCTPINACVSLNDPSWGLYGIGRILFNTDGNIYAAESSTDDRSQDVLLMPYSVQTWYDVKAVFDLTARTFDAYINGTLYATGVQIINQPGLGPEEPTGVLLYVGHGDTPSNPVVYFDDVQVY
jgi:hypothetical protein